jgi:hypothetical protein
MNKIKSHLYKFLRIFKSIYLLYICIYLYLQYILNSVFTVVFYLKR